MNVIVEPEFALSWWCKEILAGISADANRKKQTVACFDSVEDLPVYPVCEPCLLVGSSAWWLLKTGAGCQKKNMHPIVLSNQSSNQILGRFSCVYCDLRILMQDLIGYAKRLGKRHFALFGINTKSLSDMERVEGFLSYFNRSGENENPDSHIYKNDHSLKACFDAFFPYADTYDTVFCANDFAAISLIRRLQSLDYDLSQLTVISTGGTRFSRWFRPKFDSIFFPYFEFGRVGFQIAGMMKKSPNITAMNVNIQWKFQSEHILDGQAAGEDYASWSAQETQAFYKDAEIMEMITVERLLDFCDKTDFRILIGVMKNETMEQLGERCFISQTALKYRLNRLKTVSDTDSRKSLAELLRRYISEEVLKLELQTPEK